MLKMLFLMRDTHLCPPHEPLKRLVQLVFYTANSANPTSDKKILFVVLTSVKARVRFFFTIAFFAVCHL
jgi:hypothetical protein